ncbi:hypothetical protein Tco_0896642 [Tanacetum coccineum]
MTTPHPTPFPTTTLRTGVLTQFVIISDYNDEITTLPIRPTPLSSDHTSALYCYPLDSSDDLLDEDLSETAESLHTQTTLTSEIPMLSPPSLLPLSSSPPSSLLPFSSRERSRSPTLPPLPLPTSPEVVIPEATATAALARLRRIVEAHRWAFSKDGIDTWRHQEGEPRYEMGKISLA